ncbi:MAG: hypothetical protein ACJ761_02900 [Chloroflexota bacterium]
MLQLETFDRQTAARAVLLAVVTVLIAACATLSTSPAPTPADFPGITTELAKRGIVVDHIVAGDAGCADPVLAPTAIRADVHGLDQASPTRIYVYIFRNRATFERLRPTVDACARSYVSDPQAFGSVEASPFVVAGPGPWGPGFAQALRDALTVAAGTGD